MVHHQNRIEPDKGRGKPDGLPHPLEKRRSVLTGQARHQLDADLNSGLLQQAHGQATVTGGMAALRLPQNDVIQGLHAQFDDGHPPLFQEGTDLRIKTIRPGGQADTVHIATGKKGLHGPEQLVLPPPGQTGKGAALEGHLHPGPAMGPGQPGSNGLLNLHNFGAGFPAGDGVLVTEETLVRTPLMRNEDRYDKGSGDFGYHGY